MKQDETKTTLTSAGEPQEEILAATVGAGEQPGGTAGSGTGTDGQEEEGKKKRRGVTFERQLFSIESALGNSLSDPLILQYVKVYGYDETRLNEGVQLAQGARKKYEDQKKNIAARLEANRVLQTKKAEADALYRQFARIIRLGFADRENIIDTLSVSYLKKRGFGDWVAKNRIFYTNIFEMPEVLEFMAKLDITLDKIQAGQKLLEEVEAASNDLKKAKGESQRATELKNQSFDKIKRWWMNYKRIINIALAQDPQLKEKLGIVTVSES